MKHIPRNLNLPPFCRCLFLWKWCNPFPRARARRKHAHSFDRCGTSVQRHSVFEWLCKHNRLRPEPIRSVKLDSEHAQSDGKSVNRGLPVLDLARGKNFMLAHIYIEQFPMHIVLSICIHIWVCPIHIWGDRGHSKEELILNF